MSYLLIRCVWSQLNGDILANIYMYFKNMESLLYMQLYISIWDILLRHGSMIKLIPSFVLLISMLVNEGKPVMTNHDIIISFIDLWPCIHVLLSWYTSLFMYHFHDIMFMYCTINHIISMPWSWWCVICP